jgi:hypothetical protein
MLSHIREQVPTFQSRKDSILIERSFRTSPYQRSGQAIPIREIFTLDHADNLQLGKPSTVPFRGLKRKARLEQIQLAIHLSIKSQKQLILVTQNSSLEGTSTFGSIRYLLIFC